MDDKTREALKAILARIKAERDNPDIEAARRNADALIIEAIDLLANEPYEYTEVLLDAYSDARGV